MKYRVHDRRHEFTLRLPSSGSLVSETLTRRVWTLRFSKWVLTSYGAEKEPSTPIRWLVYTVLSTQNVKISGGLVQSGGALGFSRSRRRQVCCWPLSPQRREARKELGLGFRLNLSMEFQPLSKMDRRFSSLHSSNQEI